jgi:hydroxymethylglutaryl-CoA reductase
MATSKPAISVSEAANSENKPSIWAGFYKKTIQERQDQIKLVYPQLNPQQSLPATVADNMIENCVGTYELPLGLGLNFVINGNHISVPMATEEPSVIAAVSGAAKTIAGAGGFTATSSGNIMLSQIQLMDVADVEEATKRILSNKMKLITLGNTFCSNMAKRGGGVVDIRVRVLNFDSESYHRIAEKSDYLAVNEPIDRHELITKFDHSRAIEEKVSKQLGIQLQQVDGNTSSVPSTSSSGPSKPAAGATNGASASGSSAASAASGAASSTGTKTSKMMIVHVLVDVCESMGANLVTTVAEGLAPKMLELCGSGRYVLRIVSNMCEERRARSTFCVPVNKLKYKDVEGMQVAKGIIDAYIMASEDHYRATTHNKGIMNGVDAVAIAVGQDWRAVEASAHAWAARSGRYRPLTHYQLLKDSATKKMYLFGSCEFPVPIGVRGGAIQTHPVMAYTHGLVGNPTSKMLGEILTTIGLAQNFAAMRALVTEGIQRGHMGLHSRNIAIGAGAPPNLVAEVSAYMISRGRIDNETAADYLRAHSILASSTQHRFKPQKQATPSTLFVELDLQGMKVALNVVFETMGKSKPVNLSLREESPDAAINEPQANTNGTQANANANAGDDEDMAVQDELFEKKGPQWFKLTFEALKSIRITDTKGIARNNLLVQNKLKLISILLNILTHRLVSLHPEETIEFIEKILAAELNPLSMVKESDSRTIRVGFSLILSLWQVFKHQIEASITLPSLANALKEEQLRIFSASVRSRDAVKSKSLDRFMSTHTKRWQVTMFLLCDLQSLPEHLITPERLFFLFKLGQFFESEGTIAHDIAKWERDLKEGNPNSYLLWLKLHSKSPSTESLRQFISEIEEANEKKKKKLLETKEPTEFFDVKVFLQAIPVVRKHYGLDKDFGASVPKAKL